MSFRCCYCKTKCFFYNNNFETDKPCINCGKHKYFWFDYYEYKKNLKLQKTL
jgi:hypothetical protein